MSEILELTVMAYGIELDLVVECEVEPEEPQTYDSPGAPGGIEVTGVWHNTVSHSDPLGRQRQEYFIRSGKAEAENLLDEMEDEEAEHLAELAGEELSGQAADSYAEYRQGLAEDHADAMRDREMARWP